MIALFFIFIAALIGLPIVMAGGYVLRKILQSVISLVFSWPKLRRQFPAEYQDTGSLIQSFNLSSMHFAGSAHFNKCLRISMMENGLHIQPTLLGKPIFIPWNAFTFAGLKPGFDDSSLIKFNFLPKKHHFILGPDEMQLFGQTGEEVKAFYHQYLN